MENDEIKRKIEDMERLFGKPMPSPVNFPESFKYYSQIYQYYRNAENN